MSVRKFDSSDAAVPGVDPASRRTAGTLFASVYGDITPSPLQSSSRHQDAYSLFVQRASALRWLSEDTQRLWSMNDAGWSRPSKPGEKLAAWFQIEAETVPKSDSLPVQSFLHCIDEVLVRAGRHELDAVQLLLPIGDWPPPDDSAMSRCPPCNGSSGLTALTRPPERISRSLLSWDQTPRTLWCSPSSPQSSVT